jgi:hypothetical protein
MSHDIVDECTAADPLVIPGGIKEPLSSHGGSAPLPAPPYGFDVIFEPHTLSGAK